MSGTKHTVDEAPTTPEAVADYLDTEPSRGQLDHTYRHARRSLGDGMARNVWRTGQMIHLVRITAA